MQASRAWVSQASSEVSGSISQSALFTRLVAIKALEIEPWVGAPSQSATLTGLVAFQYPDIGFSMF